MPGRRIASVLAAHAQLEVGTHRPGLRAGDPDRPADASVSIAEAFGELGMLAAENLRPTGVRFTGRAATEMADPYLNFYLDRYTPLTARNSTTSSPRSRRECSPNQASPTDSRPWLSPGRWGELDRIAEATLLRNVDLGIVPRDTVADRPAPLHGFHIYDDSSVIFGTETGTAFLSDPGRVAPLRPSLRRATRRLRRHRSRAAGGDHQ
ncbi:MAG: idh [Propionibacteriaceae bacterium]|nr:idh [Propionibacteriaceae bacterium]